MPLEEVDGTTIQGYEQWLKDSGLCRNTTSFYIRNLRTIYNHAVDDGLVISSSPFKHVYTGIDERHPTGIETEQEHIPCKLQTGVQTQVQLFQLLDDFQGECPLDGLVDAGIYMLER